MFAQVSQRISPRRNCDRYRAESPRAGNVFRSVTDYEDVVLGEFGLEGSLCTAFGNWAKLISIACGAAVDCSYAQELKLARKP